MAAAVATLLLPLFLTVGSWWAYKAQSSTIPAWRQSLFTIALCLASISASVLAAFGIHAYIISRGTTPYDLDLAYPVGSMMMLAFISAFLAFFGQRLSRMLLLATGFGTVALWYLAALAASP